jgi:hypothetical protein
VQERRCASQQKLRADVADGSNSVMEAMSAARPLFHRSGSPSAILLCRESANSRHMQRSKLQFYSITSSAHFPVSNTSTSLGPQMTKWLSLGSRCAARHPTSVVTCFFFARLLWIIGAQ